MPARCPVRVFVCVRTGEVGSLDDVVGATAYMFMVESAEEVASIVPSGENFKLVMPLACALGMVCRGLKWRLFGRCGCCAGRVLLLLLLSA